MKEIKTPTATTINENSKDLITIRSATENNIQHIKEMIAHLLRDVEASDAHISFELRRCSEDRLRTAVQKHNMPQWLFSKVLDSKRRGFLEGTTLE